MKYVRSRLLPREGNHVSFLSQRYQSRAIFPGTVLLDGAYTGEAFAGAMKELVGAWMEVVQRHQLHTFVVLPKRWVVERSFALLENCRRLWKNWERKLNTSLQMVVLAFAVLILRRW
jgi:transposase